MKSFAEVLAEAYASWLNSVSSCCAPCLAERKPPRGELHNPALAWHGVDERSELSRTASEKDIAVFRDQPGLTPPPLFEPVGQDARLYKRERAPRKSFGSSLSGRSFSVRKRFMSTSSTRRPQISAPSNFRHLHSESFQFPLLSQGSPQPRQRPTSFRPLELSIYLSDNLSPILPHFDLPHPDVTPPPPAHTHDGSFDSDGVTLTHERSYSSMSFHLPRRPALDSASVSVNDSPPRIPPRSRLRANTSPDVDRLYERIAEAMLEKERLQAEIESVIERQSIYVSSRPSTAYGLDGKDPLYPSIGIDMYLIATDMEPMPSIPALPAAAPSFAERLSTDRPQTAPPRSTATARNRVENGYATPPNPATPTRSTPRINGRPVDLPLAPPLPLVLRPPLRKKKSFSRVSNWLFPGEDGHQRVGSQGSVTNVPRPVTDRDGFYQCVPPANEGRRGSLDTVSTVSSWTTEEDRTMPTTWSPGSSPVTKQDTPTPTGDRRAVFGRSVNVPQRQSVGVAF